MIWSFFEKNVSLFFSLDRKEAKDQGCKKLARNIIRNAMEIKLTRFLFKNIEYGIKQKFPFNAFLIHSFYANFLSPANRNFFLRCETYLTGLDVWTL